jgi:ABC-type bacteriocin/lantibiotic exporter with double-glycine peptidase domain
VKIELVLHQQSQPHTCVAACLRIVLCALGAQYSEKELVEACGTTRAGARLRDAAAAARSLGFNPLLICDGTFEMLADWLRQGVPVIVGIAADVLGHGASAGHAVVVCGIEQGQVILANPATGGLQDLPLDGFLRGWRRRDNRGLVVLR